MLTITFFNEVHSKKSYLNLTLQFSSKRIKQSFKEFSKIKKEITGISSSKFYLRFFLFLSGGFYFLMEHK